MSYCRQYFHYQKGCISISVCRLIQALTCPQWFTRFPVVHLVTQVTRGLPYIYTRSEVLTQQLYATQSVALPPMIGGTRLGLSVFLVVNSSTINQQEVKRKQLLYNLPLSYKINKSFMKTLFLYIKEKLLCHKKYFLTYIYIYMCSYVYHECARTLYVYMQFHVFLVIISNDNDRVIFFISRTKV